MKKYAFGVDIGGTTVKIGLFETSGMLLEKWEIPTEKEECGSHILKDIAGAINQKIMDKCINAQDIEGIGLGVPGPVLADGTVQQCVNLGWGVFNVEQELEKLTGLRVSTGNDANVAALGEMWQGGGKGCQNIVMVTLGTGVGGGVIIDGKVISGVFGAGGEIGHIKVNPGETDYCNCGKQGCLEQHSSATGLVKDTKKLLESVEEDSVLREIDNITAKEILDAAKAGDKIAVRAVEQMCNYLGLALSYISCTCDPQAYVIGGGVSKAGTILTDAIQKYFRQYAFHASEKAEFALAELGNDAGIYGSVKLLLTRE